MLILFCICFTLLLFDSYVCTSGCDYSLVDKMWGRTYLSLLLQYLLHSNLRKGLCQPLPCCMLYYVSKRHPKRAVVSWYILVCLKLATLWQQMSIEGSKHSLRFAWNINKLLLKLPFSEDLKYKTILEIFITVKIPYKAPKIICLCDERLCKLGTIFSFLARICCTHDYIWQQDVFMG